MTIKRGGLGRSLSALLSHSPTNLLADKPATDQLRLAIDCLQPGKYQPRAEIDEAPLSELVASIQQQGLLQPLIVREISNGRYEIIAGERRWRACQLAGLQEIPVVLRQVDDETAMVMALVENMQREDLTPMDQARAMYRLSSEFGLTHQQIADLLCKSRATVSNHVRLLNLSAEVRRLVENGDLDMGHARALLSLTPEQQVQVAELVVAKNLSARETEKLVARVQEGKLERHANKADLSPAIQEQVQNLARHLKTKVKVKHNQSGKGTLVIHYDTMQNLRDVVEQFIDHVMI